MIKFEYKIQTMPEPYISELDYLNKMGQQGWELITYLVHNQQYYWKREIRRTYNTPQ